MILKKLITLHKNKQKQLLKGSCLDPFNHPSTKLSKRIKLLKRRADYERELYDLKKRYFDV